MSAPLCVLQSRRFSSLKTFFWFLLLLLLLTGLTYGELRQEECGCGSRRQAQGRGLHPRPSRLPPHGVLPSDVAELSGHPRDKCNMPQPTDLATGWAVRDILQAM